MPPGAESFLCRRRRHQGDPFELATQARQTLEAVHGRPGRRPAARCRPSGAPPFHEARCALEATAFANGAAPDVASHRDLGAFTLLLSVQDGEALRLYCESVLGPIEDSDERYAGELLRSLRRTSIATGIGSARQATATATATPFAIGSSASRNSPAAT